MSTTVEPNMAFSRPRSNSRSSISRSVSPSLSHPHSRCTTPAYSVHEFQVPGSNMLNDTTRRRNWTFTELSVPKVLAGDNSTSTIPVVITNGTKGTQRESPFAPTDGKRYEGDVQIWQPNDNMIYYCSESLKAACKGDELSIYVTDNGTEEFPYDARYGKWTYAVRICGQESPASQFAGIISWSECNLAQLNYERAEEEYMVEELTSVKSTNGLKNRFKKAMESTRKGKLVNGWLTFIGKEDSIDPPFEGRFQEYLFREEVALQKIMGKKDEEFYHLKLIGVHPDYSDDKYNIKEMVLTWICYNADRQNVSCLHVLSDPSMLKTFTNHGFVATSEVVRLRHGAKLNLPLLYRKPIHGSSIGGSATPEPLDPLELCYSESALWKPIRPMVIIPPAQREAVNIALPPSVESTPRLSNPDVFNWAIAELKGKRADIFEEVESSDTTMILQGTPARAPSHATGSLREKHSPNLHQMEKIPDLTSLQVTGRRRTNVEKPSTIGKSPLPDENFPKLERARSALLFEEPRHFLRENRDEVIRKDNTAKSTIRKPSDIQKPFDGAPMPPPTESDGFMWRSRLSDSDLERSKDINLRYPSDKVIELPNFKSGRRKSVLIPSGEEHSSIGRARTQGHIQHNRSAHIGKPSRKFGSLKTDVNGRPDLAHYHRSRISEETTAPLLLMPRAKIDSSSSSSLGLPIRIPEPEFILESPKRVGTPLPDGLERIRSLSFGSRDPSTLSACELSIMPVEPPKALLARSSPVALSRSSTPIPPAPPTSPVLQSPIQSHLTEEYAVSANLAQGALKANLSQGSSLPNLVQSQVHSDAPFSCPSPSPTASIRSSRSSSRIPKLVEKKSQALSDKGPSIVIEERELVKELGRRSVRGMSSGAASSSSEEEGKPSPSSLAKRKVQSRASLGSLFHIG